MAANKASALALMKPTGAEAQIVRLVDIMKPGLAAMIQQKLPGPDGQKLADEIVIPELKNHVGPLIGLIADTYTKHFTPAEIAELRTFYESPIGTKLVREQASLAVESQQMGLAWAQSILPIILRDHADELAAMTLRAQQRGASPPVPPRQ